MLKRRTLVVGLAALPALALAHHGWSEYDMKAELKLAGTILESGYEHPHGHVRLQTAGKTWHCVLAPPSRMQARGLSKEMLKAGVHATVTGYASRSNPEEMRAERIEIGGKTVELR